MPGKQALRQLVVYYSYEGNTRYLAETIAAAVGADIAEIRLVKPLPAWRPWVMFWGGFQAVSRARVPVLPLERNPEGYQLVYIGTPVWAGNMAPAVRGWLSEARLRGRRVALFAASGSGRADRAFEEMRALLPGCDLAGELVLREPLADRTVSAHRTREWALAAARPGG